MMTVTRRFGSPAAGHDSGPSRALLQVGCMGGGVSLGLLVAHNLAWEVVAIAAVSPPSHTTELHVRWCLAKGRPQRGQPRNGGPPAVVSESHPSGESGDAERRPPRGSLSRRDRRDAGVLRQVCADGRSEHHRSAGEWDQNNIRHSRKSKVPIFESGFPRFRQVYIPL